jgi:hypothetical protein
VDDSLLAVTTSAAKISRRNDTGVMAARIAGEADQDSGQTSHFCLDFTAWIVIVLHQSVQLERGPALGGDEIP